MEKDIGTNNENEITDPDFESPAFHEIQSHPHQEISKHEETYRPLQFIGKIREWVQADARKVDSKRILEWIGPAVAIAVLYVYSRQLDVMQKQLGEMQGSGMQMSQVISNAARQADATQNVALAAKRQAGAAGDQAIAMGKQFDLNREVARLQYGGASLIVKQIHITRSDTGHYIKAGVVIQNEGIKLRAKDIGCTINIEFRSSPPKRRMASKLDRFSPTHSSEPLVPRSERPDAFGQCWDPFPSKSFTASVYDDYVRKAKAGEKIGDIYVWGFFRHSELGEQITEWFCKRMDGRGVFLITEGDRSGRGGDFLEPQSEDCETHQ